MTPYTNFAVIDISEYILYPYRRGKFREIRNKSGTVPPNNWIPYTVQLDELCYLTESASPNLSVTAADDIVRRCFIGRLTSYDLAPTEHHSGRIIPTLQ